MAFAPLRNAAQRRENRRRQEEAAERDQDICRSCFQVDHRRSACNQVPIVACSECYKMNVFTTNCCQRNGREEIQGQRQVLRFAGFPIPRMFMDVNVLTVNIPALIDTGSERSSIDSYLANMMTDMQIFGDTEDCFKTSTGMSVPIGIRGTVHWMNCEIKRLPPTIHLVLGMDYFMMRPFSFTFENVTLNSRRNWPIRHHEETNYVYNTPRGQELRQYLGRRRDYRFQSSSRKRTFDRYRQYFSNNPRLQNRYY